MIVKLIIILTAIFIFSGCERYYSFDNYQNTAIIDSGISQEEICNIISQNKTSWISENNKCTTKITDNLVRNAILFSKLCSNKFRNGEIQITSGKTTCKIYNSYIDFQDNFDEKFQKFDNWKSRLLEESKDVQTIEEICPVFKNTTYNSSSRSCEFPKNEIIPSAYMILEESIRKRDTIAYKKEVQKFKNIKLWEEEAKNWKGSLDDLCENLTEYSNKNSFDKNSLNCTTFNKQKIEKYDVMKPYLVEQHKRIMEKREKIALEKAEEEKVLIAEHKQKWENRIGKSSKIKSGKSYICETNVSINPVYGIYIPRKINLDAGYSTIEIQNYMTFYYVDSFEDYELYKGYTNDYKMYKLQINNNKILKTKPYSFYLEGIGYYCENK